MAKEYIEREAVLEKQKTFTEYDEGGWDAAVRAVPVNAIKSIPAADVVEVVRCKDCKSRHDSCFAGTGNTYCDVHHKYFPLDGFCSYGERRDNDGRNS